MSGAQGSLGLDMSDVAKALARLPAMTSTEAEKAVRELTKSFDKAGRESKRLADQAQRDAVALRSIESNAKLGAEAMGKLTAAASMVSPELAQGIDSVKRLVDVLGTAAGGGGQLAMALGPVAAAVGLVAASWVVLQREEEQAQALMQRSAETAQMVEAQHRSLEAARIDLALATGQITQAEASQQQAALDVQSALTDLHAETRKQHQEQEEAARSAQRWLDVIDATIFKLNPYVQLVGAAADKLMGWSATVDAAAQAQAQLEQREAAMATQIVATADARLEAAAAREAERAEAERAAAADRAAGDAARTARQVQAEAAREAVAAEAERERQQVALGAAMDRLREQESRLRVGMLEGSARVQAELALEIARVDELAQAYADSAEVQAEAEEVRLALREAAALREAEIAAAAAQEAAKAQEEADKERKAADRAAAQASADAASQQRDAVVDTVDASIAAFEALASSQGAAWKEAAVIAYRLNQARALAQIPIDLAAANSSILAAWAHNPAVMGGLMALAAGTSAMQAAAIVAAPAPKLHVGGQISAHTSAAPDEVDILTRVLPGEQLRVEPRHNGGGERREPIVVVASYQHRPLDVQVGDQLRMPRSQLSTAIRAARRKRGHRER